MGYPVVVHHLGVKLVARATSADANNTLPASFYRRCAAYFISFRLSAKTIAEVYQDYWQIVILFHFPKQNLKVKAFIGNSENAVMTSYVALIAYLLLGQVTFLQSLSVALQTGVCILPLNLFRANKRQGLFEPPAVNKDKTLISKRLSLTPAWPDRIVPMHVWNFPVRLVAIFMVAALGAPAAFSQTGPGPESLVDASRWPAGYFFPYHKAPLKEKDTVLQSIAARLDRLQAVGQGLLVKGAILDPLRTDVPLYDRLRILDDSGLLIVVHRVPNIYFRFGGGPLNRNTFLVVKNPRVNYLDSYITQNFVVEGDFWAYVQSYIDRLRREVQPSSAAPPVK